MRFLGAACDFCALFRIHVSLKPLGCDYCKNAFAAIQLLDVRRLDQEQALAPYTFLWGDISIANTNG